MDNFQIETAQNVEINQNTANVGERILAFIIDVLIIIAFELIMGYFFEALDLDKLPKWSIIIIFSLVPFLYHLAFETFWNGHSPGKAILKLRVVKMDGSKPAFSNYAIRWILRPIEITSFLGSIATVTILLNGRGQRLGDLAAETTVITERRRIQLNQTVSVDLPTGYEPKYTHVTVFSDLDIQKAKNLFQTAKRNADHKMLIVLAERLSNVMQVEPKTKPMQFVTDVINDYNYFTQQ